MSGLRTSLFNCFIIYEDVRANASLNLIALLSTKMSGLTPSYAPSLFNCFISYEDVRANAPLYLIALLSTKMSELTPLLI